MSKILYTKTHGWVLPSGNKAKIGISDYAQKELGDLVFVELPSIGKKVEIGEEVCSVESVKAVSSVYSPVSGVVVAVNTELESAPEKINQTPLDAWIAEIEFDKIEDGLTEEDI